MSATLWSSHFSAELYHLYWEGLSRARDQWSILERLLLAFTEQVGTLGRISGELQVVSERQGERAFEQWHVTTDAARLQAVLLARLDEPQPVEWPLHLQPLLWLPDNCLDVVDIVLIY